MARISWQQNHNHRFETGIERGVLYPDGKDGVAWNGLTSVVVKSTDKEVEPYYYDGLGYLNYVKPGDFSGELRALTYPDEFLPYDGVSQPSSGLFATNQPIRETFGLSHATLIGDSSGETPHRQIHFYYNLVAIPSDRAHTTITSEPDLVDFSWTLEGVPVDIPGHRPSVHFFVDSRFFRPNQVALLEDAIYGTPSTPPRLPLPSDIQNILG